MEEEQIKDFRDYIDAFRRRRIQMVASGGAIFAIVLIVALVWPPVYRSSATILIEEQEIPADLVRSTITSYAAQRIEMIKQRVMSRTNLLKVIKKYDLYVNERRRKTTEEIIIDMREDIVLDMINADVVDPRSGRPTEAAIAFSLSYEGRSPELTQRVANELTSLYLSENIRNRTEKASETYNFLSLEAEKLSKKISLFESKIAEFKEKHLGSLPELASLNISVMDRVDRELMETERTLRTQEERMFLLGQQLAQINPYKPMVSDTGEMVLDPSSRLQMLRFEYTNAKVKYASDHPDLIRLKREIGGLEKQLGESPDPEVEKKELTRLRAELSAAKEKYGPDHPDVLRLKRAVAELEREPAEFDSGAKEEKREVRHAKKPENPAYIQLQSQLNSTTSDIQALRIKRNGLKRKLSEYEERIGSGPKIEQEYNILKRDYANAATRYQEIKAKQMEAEIAQELEKESKGERFSLVDPAQLPESPIKPNRPVIIFLGFILSLTGSFGYVFIVEAIDNSIRGSKGVERIMGMAPLAIIPYWENEGDIEKRARIRKYIYIFIIVAIISVILAIHFLWTPLDVLWFKGLRKADDIVGS